MAKSEVKVAHLLDNDIDIENQAAAEISRGNEDYVALSGSPANDSNERASGCTLRSGRTKRAAVVLGCTAAIALVLGAAVSYNFSFGSDRPESPDGQLLRPKEPGLELLHEEDGDAENKNDFYSASRTGYHFQPETNWMNDPNGPLFYKGYYHFFYQYNPKGLADPFVGMHWGHTVSTDLIHWTYLEMALKPDKWYDEDGVWSGSATILEDGTPVMVYTGVRNMNPETCDQTQNVAFPVDPSDPLLRKWRKVDRNPIILPPNGIKDNDFRDPTSAWLESDGLWRFAVGAKRDNADGTSDGIALLYKSKDFVNWELEKHLREGVDTGMWECVDFYPVSAQGGQGGLDHSVLKAETFSDEYKYVLKAGLQVWEQDHYTLGNYSTDTHSFTVDDPASDIGKGYRYDYGKYYASKTFYDTNTGRRILWGWANESDSREDQLTKGWASVQTIPRAVWLDEKTSKNLIVWPVDEVKSLRGKKTSLRGVSLKPAAVIKISGGDANQLDIEVVFEKPDVSNVVGKPEAVDFDCGQGGSAHRGVFGPFGLLVHADDKLIEHTGVFFYVSLLRNGHWATRACSDQSRSSLAPGLDKTVYGSYVPLVSSEDELSMRILVDHSIVETFVQGGRFAITSRVYPTIAIGSRTRLFLFNNGTSTIKVKSLDVYQMASVNMTTY